MKKVFKCLWIIPGILLDQLTKRVVVQTMLMNQSIQLIPGFFSLTYVRNTGAGFSILEGQRNLFMILTVLAMALFMYMYIHTKEDALLEQAAILMVISGTLGNFIDRFLYGSVVDFLDFIIFGYDFPIFNVADILLVVGVGLYIIVWYLEERKHA